MANLSIIENAKDELTSIFKDLHQNPELGFAELSIVLPALSLKNLRNME